MWRFWMNNIQKVNSKLKILLFLVNKINTMLMFKLLNNMRKSYLSWKISKLMDKMLIWKYVSHIIKYILTNCPIISANNKFSHISENSVQLRVYSYYLFKVITKIQKKNLTIIIVISDIKKINLLKTVSLQKIDTQSKTKKISELLEHIKLDKMMKLIKNFSLKLLQLFNSTLIKLKKNYMYFYIIN